MLPMRPGLVREAHHPSLLVCLLSEDLQESARGAVPEVPGWGGTQKYSVSSEYCEASLSYRTHCLPCDYDSS